MQQYDRLVVFKQRCKFRAMIGLGTCICHPFVPLQVYNRLRFGVRLTELTVIKLTL